MEILRILQKSSQSADGTKLKLCQEPFANSADERTQIKALRLYALSSLVKVWENPIHATIESSETYTNYKEKREEIWLSPVTKDSIPMFWKFIKSPAVT